MMVTNDFKIKLYCSYCVEVNEKSHIYPEYFLIVKKLLENTSCHGYQDFEIGCFSELFVLG